MKSKCCIATHSSYVCSVAILFCLLLFQFIIIIILFIHDKKIWIGFHIIYFLHFIKVGKERNLGFEPLCVSYFSRGEYILVSGCDKTCFLMTRDGIKLGTVGEEHQSWVWCCAPRPDSTYVVCFYWFLVYYFHVSF